MTFREDEEQMIRDWEAVMYECSSALTKFMGFCAKYPHVEHDGIIIEMNGNWYLSIDKSEDKSFEEINRFSN